MHDAKCLIYTLLCCVYNYIATVISEDRPTQDSTVITKSSCSCVLQVGIAVGAAIILVGLVAMVMSAVLIFKCMRYAND